MDFFESQDTARRNTGRLVLLFGLAVLSLIVITNLLVMAVFGVFSTQFSTGESFRLLEFNWQTFLVIGAGVVTVILIGSLYKIGVLSGGGARVAEMMDARLVLPESTDLTERKLLNVVEEMAIASGTPVPPVYLIDEPGINAFAAGFAPADAVIGITRGAMESLSREELQGVIAHEFSHILHGDMRINIRLIGILHGILVLGIIGYYLMRGGAHGRRSRDGAGIMVLGLGLVAVGYIGTFFGNLIKAAVSRQREYLADASAVQFTRNPDGIAGALMRIATHQEHSFLQHPSSSEISHALFEEPRRSMLTRLYATHPPLDDRIRAILPDWDGEFLPAPGQPDSSAEGPAAPEQRQQQAMEVLAGTVLAGAGIAAIGNPDRRALAQAEELLQQLPPALMHAAHNPGAARALIYFLVLSQDEGVRGQQLQLLEQAADQGVYGELLALIESGATAAPEQRLPLVEVALASLRQISRQQYELFRDNFGKVIAVDGRLSLFEWCLQEIVFHNLRRVFAAGSAAQLGRQPLKRHGEAVQILLGLLVHCQPQQGISAEQAFEQGVAELRSLELGGLKLPARKALNFTALKQALDALQEVKPLQKPQLLKACAACITADRDITAVEAELFRAVAAILDCPMPPLRV